MFRAFSFYDQEARMISDSMRAFVWGAIAFYFAALAVCDWLADVWDARGMQ